ncbi:MAG: hypothetical protein Unbinned338contig1000_39 [Prokaryotic dsDNA virus sp.]|nr:MAG: hypothetical protein Unbinned338contig1000_39 [Prokaryotic dsDNA virus sp.]|tara:strand:+ start:23159 stop:24292 length:1134 start_codon:yes stop_codon:yes gene_type:complete
MIKFSDVAPLMGTRKTADGYLIADAYIARSGIQFYAGSEIGIPDKAVIRVYRPQDEVMSPASVQTYSHAPITMNHPDVFVDATNVADLGKGEVSTEAQWIDGKLKLPLIVKDAAAVAAVESGAMRGLSAGYTCQLDHTPGITEDGQAYDAVQRSIRINHVALCPMGRAGEEFRIGDSAATWGASPISAADMKGSPMADTLQTVVLGDQAAQVAIADAPKIEAFKAAQAKALTDAQTAHATAIAAKDAEIAVADAARDAAEAKVLSDADLDKRVADRADLIAVAKTIDADVATAGLSDAAIRKAVVVAKLGDAMADKPDAYIVARFDALADAAEGADPVAKAIGDAKTAPKVVTLDAAYDARDADLSNAWMSKPAKEA